MHRVHGRQLKHFFGAAGLVMLTGGCALQSAGSLTTETLTNHTRTVAVGTDECRQALQYAVGRTHDTAHIVDRG